MGERKVQAQSYLECERIWVFLTLIFVGGYFGGYTYNVRGGVFCNAQTANTVILAMRLGQGDFAGAVPYLESILAYFLGIVVSEVFGSEIKRIHLLRWDTVLVGLELIAVILLGLMPAAWPDRICHITLNFLTAMQFNTFRQAEGIGAATTFCTNHIRLFLSHLVKFLRSGHGEDRRRYAAHGGLILSFFFGALAATLFSRVLQHYSILLSALPLLAVFLRLAIADRTYERDLLMQVPRGH